MKLNQRVAYLGDDRIGGAATYLSGIMKHYGIAFDRVDSSDAPPSGFFDRPYSLYILSDYPRARFPAGAMEQIVENTATAGSGLLMIGGWESFHGRLGEYNDTPISEALPVVMQTSDDRRNVPLSIILRTLKPHPVVDDLPWNSPPGIGGYNAFTPKPEADLIVEGVRIELQVLGDDVDTPNMSAVSSDGFNLLSGRRIVVPLVDGDSIAVRPVEQVPMLVVGQYGNGRTAAFASDVAPHWVGGFVDWGPNRVTEPIGSDGGFIEVGESYAKFWRNLVNWTAQF